MKIYSIRIEDGHHIVDMSPPTPTLEQAMQNAAKEIEITIDGVIGAFRSLFEGVFPDER